MTIKIIVASSILLASLTGCGLIPKRVEFFQDKVHRFPEYSEVQLEAQKEAAWLAQERAQVAVREAFAAQVPAKVKEPVQDTAKLTAVVSGSLGPPLKVNTNVLAVTDNLRRSVAKLDRKIDEFKIENNENAGKKIEGTGLFSVPYFVWAGGALLLAIVALAVIRMVLTAASLAHPGAAVGLGVVNAAASLVGKGFTQVVKGGEAFKAWVEKEISDPVVKQKVLDAFHSSQDKYQDHDVKDLVNKVQ